MVAVKGNQNILFTLFLFFPFSFSLLFLYALASPASYIPRLLTSNSITQITPFCLLLEIHCPSYNGIPFPFVWQIRLLLLALPNFTKPCTPPRKNRVSQQKTILKTPSKLPQNSTALRSNCVCQNDRCVVPCITIDHN
uniref:Putative secreted peptide n=1 Tax=Anopheles braziliensis TaxID=58242 RepID=A0A2M3ZTI4_9DIPT